MSPKRDRIEPLPQPPAYEDGLSRLAAGIHIARSMAHNRLHHMIERMRKTTVPLSELGEVSVIVHDGPVLQHTTHEDTGNV